MDESPDLQEDDAEEEMDIRPMIWVLSRRMVKQLHVSNFQAIQLSLVVVIQELHGLAQLETHQIDFNTLLRKMNRTHRILKIVTIGCGLAIILNLVVFVGNLVRAIGLL